MESESIKYELSINVKLNYLNPPQNIEEKIKREMIQTKIDAKVYQFVHDPLNKQNLMNMILENINILI